MYPLPESINDESNRILSGIIERRFNALDLTRLLIYLIDEVSDGALPLLVDQFHVGGFEGGALAENATNRRALVKSAILIHRRKGTPAALKQAIHEAGFGEVTIIELSGDRLRDGSIIRDGTYTHVTGSAQWADYHIVLERMITNDQAILLRRLCEEVAPARCRLIRMIYTEVAARHNGVIIRNGSYNRGMA